MAGTIKAIDEPALITADRTQKVSGSGAHGSAQFYVDVTAITRTTGTLAVTVRWKSADGTVVIVATVASLSATGISRLTPTSGVFDTAGRCIPEPNEVFWDLVGDTTLVSGKVYVMYGD